MINPHDTNSVIDETAYLLGRMRTEPRLRAMTSLQVRQPQPFRRALLRSLLRTFFVNPMTKIEREALVDTLRDEVKDASEPVARPERIANC